ncbi:DNA-binding transcriptional regulator [Thalassobacillus sp. CUG 92003]|uniref:helix-turn-helix domain-containing protein n=1 Tax=Thalassobacillus sp. CUG 92003 TaxID=2736641 RepID=UPI0015E7C809|nr:hypothetical protein [Thalassobacillus sp. CUG 92003]
MERKLTKAEFKAIRLVLSFTQPDFAELLGISVAHVSRTEEVNSKHQYAVSKRLDETVKETLERLYLDLEDILEIAKRRGIL